MDGTNCDVLWNNNGLGWTSMTREHSLKEIHIHFLPIWFSNPGMGHYDVAATLLNKAYIYIWYFH